MTTKTEEKGHTPTPWSVDYEIDGSIWIQAEGHPVIAWAPDYTPQNHGVRANNLEFACLAVNNHEALKKALTKMCDGADRIKERIALEAEPDGIVDMQFLFDSDQARALLASLEKNNG